MEKENKIFFWVAIILWTLIISCSIFWNMYTLKDNTSRLVSNIAKAFFKEIETTRLWNATHGGVYAPITETMQPNLYLDVPNRDITSIDGLELTLVNPAFMTRQLSEIARQENDIWFHITSLSPIRPQNKPDKWEINALNAFEKGSREFMEYLEDQQVYRFMAPLYVKQACLKCHEKQGYEIGDVRGGISISLPAKDHIDDLWNSRYKLLAVHIAFFVVGMLAFYSFRRTNELKLNNERLKTAKDKAEGANRAKSEFLSNMTHELRTPLHHVLSFARISIRKIKDNSTGRLMEYQNNIVKSGNSLLNLIDNLLDLSKLEAGKMEFKMREEDFILLVEYVVGDLRPKIQEKGLIVDIEKPMLFPRVKCDSEKIMQVIQNLISNAIKFTPAGKKISISLEELRFSVLDPSNPVVQFKMVDQGIGLPEAELENIFNTFTQSTSTKTGAGGTGLGLAICKEIVEAHQGMIWAENNPESGATFCFVLPIEQEAE